MRRYLLTLMAASGLICLWPLAATAATKGSAQHPNCTHGAPTCTEVVDSIGEYTGHDEPSLLFYSNSPGSGNSNLYHLTLPTDPKTQPTQDGKGATWNFQLHPAFWFGMAICDSESSPEFTHTCTPDSDSNIFTSDNPSDPHYIGKHPGTAFMEMQFYPPGWVSWPAGNSCDATKWCAALNIDSLSEDQNAATAAAAFNNDACLNTIGLEPVNFAFITKSGSADSPGDPQNFDHFTPNLATDLLMNSGDRLTVDLHDTPAGLVVVIRDLTTGTTGSMTASTANGFAQIKFDPTASSCTSIPYAFHPMYSTSSEDTRVVWAAHSYNVAFSDEIGHFEYCSTVDAEGGNCTSNNETLDDDDVFCFSPALSLLVQVGGCFGSDEDFDGPSYQQDWPGTGRNHGQDKKLHSTPIQFSSPLFTPATGHGSANYDRAAFETDLPRIEAPDSGGICNRTTGADCVNPPAGAAFYPIYVTVSNEKSCAWAEGGAGIDNATNTFGGTSTAEFGPLLTLLYPGPGFVPVHRINNFRNVLSSNPCTRNAEGDDDH
jgi:hypothetical protein